ncbi:hypothetical protein TIFTF001_038014 [Ficus carica]|uniref:Uncharacterized protein n=1 Tax=Ficus carica TaxID=3494 RepID=A0AA88JE52_FICCA|nr:hypothetical protein TIFTF001_038014 [Ficus carica]
MVRRYRDRAGTLQILQQEAMFVLSRLQIASNKFDPTGKF